MTATNYRLGEFACIREDGRLAAHRGQRLIECPHSFLSEAGDRWKEGWTVGFREALAEQRQTATSTTLEYFLHRVGNAGDVDQLRAVLRELVLEVFKEKP